MDANRASMREKFLFNSTQTDSKSSAVDQIDQKLEDLRHLQPAPQRKSSFGTSQIPKPVIKSSNKDASTLPRATGTAGRNRTQSGSSGIEVQIPPLTKGAKTVSHGCLPRTPESSYRNNPSTAWARSHESLMPTRTTQDDAPIRSPTDIPKRSPYPQRKKSLFGGSLVSSPEESNVPAVSDREYYMKNSRRGKAVIFSHNKFDDEEDMTRAGAQIDVANLKRSLPRLGFLPQDIIVHSDLTYAEIKDVLDNLSNETHGDSDCLLVIVLTHGKEGEQLHARDTTYATEKIWKPFLGDRCEGLRGKPKIFFIVACRGKLADPGVKLANKIRRPSTTATDSTPFSYKTVSYTIPVHADVLTVYSTQPLHYSFREGDRGTWYVEAFCNELNKLPAGVPINFTDFLTQVNLKVGVTYEAFDKDSNFHKMRQCPSYTSTLTRAIYISPVDAKN